MVSVLQFQPFQLSNFWLLKSAEIYWTPTTNIGDFSILENKNSRSFFKSIFLHVSCNLITFGEKNIFNIKKNVSEKFSKFNIYRFHKLRTVIQNILGGRSLTNSASGRQKNETQLARANRNNTESEHPFILSNEVMS